MSKGIEAKQQNLQLLSLRIPYHELQSLLQTNYYLNFARVRGFHMQALNNAADGSLRLARRVKSDEIK